MRKYQFLSVSAYAKGLGWNTNRIKEALYEGRSQKEWLEKQGIAFEWAVKRISDGVIVAQSKGWQS